MRAFLLSMCLVVSLLRADSARAQGGRGPRPRPANHFGLSYRPAFNISATFEGIGGYAAPSNPGAAVGGDVDRVYDDGYNRRDVSPSDGLTWHWGYVDAATQISDDWLLLSRSSSVADGVSSDQDSGPQPGVELTYRRELRAWPSLRLGLEGAFNFTWVDIDDSQPTPSSVTRLTDAYALGGIIPPQAPPPAWAYEGTFLGPGALISDTPAPRPPLVIPNGAVTSGRRNLEASVYGFRVGPYLEVPIGRHVTFSLSGGLAIAAVNSEFEFDESTSIAGVGPVQQSGRDTGDDLLLGGFAAGNLSYAFTPSVNVFAGVQYQNVGHYHQRTGAREVTVDLGESIFMTLGAGVSF